MNRTWHEEHKMPAKASEQERIQWHLEHAQACRCRPFPAKLMEKLSGEDKRKLEASRAG